MTIEEVRESVANETEMDESALEEAFRAVYGRAPDEEDGDLYSHICAGIGMYSYTIRTDGVMSDIDAYSMDEAAKIFAAGEFPEPAIESVDDLFAHIARIGDGAWCWIESANDPNGARQSENC